MVGDKALPCLYGNIPHADYQLRSPDLSLDENLFLNRNAIFCFRFKGNSEDYKVFLVWNSALRRNAILIKNNEATICSLFPVPTSPYFSFEFFSTGCEFED